MIGVMHRLTIDVHCHLSGMKQEMMKVSQCFFFFCEYCIVVL